MSILDLSVTAAPSLREQVADRVREAILSGVFAPGDRLVERELCELTGVSRTSLREALRGLVAEGLLVTVPNKGLTVAIVGPREATELYEVRSVMEGLAARLFVRTATDDEVASLGHAVQRLSEQFHSDEPEPFLSIKDALFEEMLTVAGNDSLHSMLNQIYARLRRLQCASSSSKGRRQELIGQIGELFAALSNRDEDRASAIAVANVERAREVALAMMAERAPNLQAVAGTR